LLIIPVGTTMVFLVPSAKKPGYATGCNIQRNIPASNCACWLWVVSQTFDGYVLSGPTLQHENIRVEWPFLLYCIVWYQTCVL